MKQYNPHSHFFTDIASLAPASGVDGFGPVNGSLTTKYRVTSKVKAINTSLMKLYAICDGTMLIQPQTGDDSKINIIIKPSTNNYSPLKIKYFIYRGVNKTDYFTNNVLNQPGVSKPDSLNKMWVTLVALNGLTSPAGNIFPLDYVYDFAAAETKLIDNAFQKSLISCKEGDYIGNFNGEIGLDIVLDQGEYTLENQEVLFDFNLKYARAKEFIFDTDTITGDVKKKRFKENINQFIDAAAFWGSHITCGTIQYKNGTKITKASEISDILKKYQTGNKLYIYLQENNRSFNYYDSSRKIYGFDNSNTGEDYKTNDWPILIKEANSDKKLLIEYQIDTNIDRKDRQVSLEFIYGKGSYLLRKTDAKNLLLSKNKYFDYDLKIFDSTHIVTIDNNQTLPAGLQLMTSQGYIGRIIGTPSTTEIKELDFIVKDSNGIIIRVEKLKFYVGALDLDLKFNIDNTGKAYADMMFINCDMQRKSPVLEYYNNLWIPNIKSSVEYGTGDIMHWVTCDKNRNINLDDVFGESVIIQNKVIFDKGEKKGAVISNKKRRLFTAIIKNNSSEDKDYDLLNIDKISSGYTEMSTSENIYFMNIFNDPTYSVYKGTFKDGLNIINSLSISNDDDLLKRYSYMFLGLTEDDYNKFLIPTNADNIFFNLEEITSFTTDNVFKFRVGLRFEDNTGVITTIYPSSDVYVYSLDGVFFFSADFSEYQTFSKTYPKAKAEFRVQTSYQGEFGFDWMRIGDTVTSGDISYKNIVGKLYTDATYTQVVDDFNQDNGFFKKDMKLIRRLEKEYLMYPIQWENNNNVYNYYLPTLNIYPPYVTPTSGIDLDRQPIFSSPYDDIVNRSANLNLRIDIKERPSRIFLQYDNAVLNVTPISTIPTTIGQHNINLTIKTRGEVSTDQYIKVMAVYGSKNKIIGILKVSKNAKINRKAKKVVLVTVKTNINGTVVEPVAKDKALFLKKYLRQIFISPQIENISVDVSSDSVFNTKYTYLSPSNTYKILVTGDDTNLSLPKIHEYIVAKTAPGSTLSIKDKYPDSFILLFFAERGGQIRNVSLPPPNDYQGLNGYSAGRFITGFVLSNNATPTHEFLHSANVPHSFAAYEADKFAKFTYKPDNTNNILDYASIPRVSIWEWQGKIARKSANNEP